MADQRSTARFIKEERIAQSTGIVALHWRLFKGFRFFLAILPLILTTIVVSSSAPSVFRWYSGNFASGEAGFTLDLLVWIAALAIVLRIGAWALFEITAMWSSQRLHAAMVQGLAGTRTTFFDENASGSLINRLIRDYEEVRGTTIVFVGDLFNVTVELLSVGVIAGLGNPWAALLIFPLLGIFVYIQSNRQAMLSHARSFAAIATGQVLSRKNDLIEGREVFLLYGRTSQLMRRMTGSFRRYLQASALTFQIEIWATFWVRIAAEFFSLSVLLFTAAALFNGRIGAALAGVIISALFGVTGSINWLDFATSLVSRSSPHLRRVFEFVDLPAEYSEEGRPERDQVLAKHEDGIEFVNYSMSYRADTPVILHKLNFYIPPRSKTALVGRTGSGKTSVLQALMRMVYVQAGDIRISGHSIYKMDVQTLRRQFGVVPQSPYLFAGTVRSNLDRIGALSDSALQSALTAVGLKIQLDDVIQEGGQNLSVGERQLVCLARVIAADRPIVLMDEPTSGLDPETDARISEVLRTALRDKTVLTIAHRRESLGHYDRVIEMRDGKVSA